MRVFFDSSAFAKRYVDEAGTPEVLGWCDRANELLLSVIAVPELVSAFQRLLREERLDSMQYRQIKRELLEDIAGAVICDTTQTVVRQAIDALEARPLRAMDALHLAAALANRADVFVSADARQCDAARHFGLQVVSLP
ncbi:MAG: type II toxin-antitoxin system VapC family toxin [Steroidobacteraceae bacterium]